MVMFLMHGRDALPGKLEKVAYLTGLTAIAKEFKLSAYAQTPSQRKETEERADVAPFSQLKLLLTNYQKAKKAAGCFGFSTNTALTDPNKRAQELDISFSDLEDALSYPIEDRYKQVISRFLITP
jgi:hypothetical protein